MIMLPGRGETFVRQVEGPPGAPTLLLLHGLSATADLNWFPAFGPLGRHFNVVALDHRGHGRGIRSRRRFRLADCADDAVALADVLGIERFIPVGYSMGGPIAQLAWHRHRSRVDGLVLCATSRNFRGRPREQAMYATLPFLTMASRLMPTEPARKMASLVAAPNLRREQLRQWMQGELERSDMRVVLEASHAIGRYSSHGWIGDVDVPTAVVVATNDQLVPARRQIKLARSIPGATAHFVDADHFSIALDPDRVIPTLVDACRLVAERAGSSRSLRLAG